MHKFHVGLLSLCVRARAFFFIVIKLKPIESNSCVHAFALVVFSVGFFVFEPVVCLRVLSYMRLHANEKIMFHNWREFFFFKKCQKMKVECILTPSLNQLIMKKKKQQPQYLVVFLSFNFALIAVSHFSFLRLKCSLSNCVHLFIFPFRDVGRCTTIAMVDFLAIYLL